MQQARKSKTAFDNRASVGGVLEAPSAELLPAPLHEAGGARDHSSGRHDRWSRRACRAPCGALLVTGVFSHGAQGGGRAEMTGTSFSTAVGSWPKRDEEAFERGKQVPTYALASLLAHEACVPVNTASVARGRSVDCRSSSRHVLWPHDFARPPPVRCAWQLLRSADWTPKP
jgi:hypothetical protein